MESSEPIAKFFDLDVRPPRSGYRVVLEGREFIGGSESDVLNEVKRWRTNNDTFTSDYDIEREVWEYWRSNEPNRVTNQRMPSLGRMAVNAAKSVVRTVKAAAMGQEIAASEKLTAERKAICMSCPKMVIQDGAARCSACGCFLSYKTALSQEKCPQGKW